MSDDLVSRLREPVTLSGMRGSVEVYQAVIVQRAEAANRIEADNKLIQEMRDALNEIRELNLENEDENGHRWANSDMINQTVVFALSKAKSQQEGETE